jgi:hypothetical protein
MAAPTRHAKPDAELVKYMQEALALLAGEDAPPDAEGRGLLVRNVLAEAEGECHSLRSWEAAATSSS